MTSTDTFAPIAYYTCETPGDPIYGSCGHRHRTAETAYRCLHRAHLRIGRLPGGNSYCPWTVVAVDTDGHYVPAAEWDTEDW